MESELQMIAAKREKLGQNLGLVLFGSCERCSTWLLGWLKCLEICTVVLIQFIYIYILFLDVSLSKN